MLKPSKSVLHEYVFQVKRFGRPTCVVTVEAEDEQRARVAAKQYRERGERIDWLLEVDGEQTLLGVMALL